MKTATLIIGIIQLVRLLSVDGDIVDLDNETIDPKSLGESDAMFMVKLREIKSTYDSRPQNSANNSEFDENFKKILSALEMSMYDLDEKIDIYTDFVVYNRMRLEYEKEIFNKIQYTDRLLKLKNLLPKCREFFQKLVVRLKASYTKSNQEKQLILNSPDPECESVTFNRITISPTTTTSPLTTTRPPPSTTTSPPPRTTTRPPPPTTTTRPLPPTTTRPPPRTTARPPPPTTTRPPPPTTTTRPPPPPTKRPPPPTTARPPPPTTPRPPPPTTIRPPPPTTARPPPPTTPRPPPPTTQHPTDVAIQKQFDIYKVRKWGNVPYPEFDDALWQLFMASNSENMNHKKKALDKFLKYDKERKDLSILIKERRDIYVKQFHKEKNPRCKADLKSILIQYEKTKQQKLSVKRAALKRKPICKF